MTRGNDSAGDGEGEKELKTERTRERERQTEWVCQGVFMCQREREKK